MPADTTSVSIDLLGLCLEDADLIAVWIKTEYVDALESQIFWNGKAKSAEMLSVSGRNDRSIVA